MECRENCGACCIYPSISSSIPGMENGKPKNMPCIQLTEDLKCKLFNHPLRPQICKNFQPEEEICGKTAEEAKNIFSRLE